MAAVEILRRDALLFHLGVLALVAIIVGQGVGIYVGLASLSTQEDTAHARQLDLTLDHDVRPHGFGPRRLEEASARCAGPAAMEAVCGRARNAGGGECFVCLSMHVRELGVCDDDDSDRFCNQEDAEAEPIVPISKCVPRSVLSYELPTGDCPVCEAGFYSMQHNEEPTRCLDNSITLSIAGANVNATGIFTFHFAGALPTDFMGGSITVPTSQSVSLIGSAIETVGAQFGVSGGALSLRLLRLARSIVVSAGGRVNISECSGKLSTLSVQDSPFSSFVVDRQSTLIFSGAVSLSNAGTINLASKVFDGALITVASDTTLSMSQCSGHINGVSLNGHSHLAMAHCSGSMAGLSASGTSGVELSSTNLQMTAVVLTGNSTMSVASSSGSITGLQVATAAVFSSSYGVGSWVPAGGAKFSLDEASTTALGGELQFHSVDDEPTLIARTEFMAGCKISVTSKVSLHEVRLPSTCNITVTGWVVGVRDQYGSQSPGRVVQASLDMVDMVDPLDLDRLAVGFAANITIQGSIVTGGITASTISAGQTACVAPGSGQTCQSNGYNCSSSIVMQSCTGTLNNLELNCGELSLDASSSVTLSDSIANITLHNSVIDTSTIAALSGADYPQTALDLRGKLMSGALQLLDGSPFVNISIHDTKFTANVSEISTPLGYVEIFDSHVANVTSAGLLVRHSSIAGNLIVSQDAEIYDSHVVHATSTGLLVRDSSISGDLSVTKDADVRDSNFGHASQITALGLNLERTPVSWRNLASVLSNSFARSFTFVDVAVTDYPDVRALTGTISLNATESTPAGCTCDHNYHNPITPGCQVYQRKDYQNKYAWSQGDLTCADMHSTALNRTKVDPPDLIARLGFLAAFDSPEGQVTRRVNDRWVTVHKPGYSLFALPSRQFADHNAATDYAEACHAVGLEPAAVEGDSWCKDDGCVPTGAWKDLFWFSSSSEPSDLPAGEDSVGYDLRYTNLFQRWLPGMRNFTKAALPDRYSQIPPTPLPVPFPNSEVAQFVMYRPSTSNQIANTQWKWEPSGPQNTASEGPWVDAWDRAYYPLCALSHDPPAQPEPAPQPAPAPAPAIGFRGGMFTASGVFLSGSLNGTRFMSVEHVPAPPPPGVYSPSVCCKRIRDTRAALQAADAALDANLAAQRTVAARTGLDNVTFTRDQRLCASDRDRLVVAQQIAQQKYEDATGKGECHGVLCPGLPPAPPVLIKKLDGAVISIVGTDDGVVFWTLSGQEVGNGTQHKITANFGPTGGAAQLNATFDESTSEITWQDGGFLLGCDHDDPQCRVSDLSADLSGALKHGALGMFDRVASGLTCDGAPVFSRPHGHNNDTLYLYRVAQTGFDCDAYWAIGTFSQDANGTIKYCVSGGELPEYLTAGRQAAGTRLPASSCCYTNPAGTDCAQKWGIRGTTVPHITVTPVSGPTDSVWKHGSGAEFILSPNSVRVTDSIGGLYVDPWIHCGEQWSPNCTECKCLGAGTLKGFRMVSDRSGPRQQVGNQLTIIGTDDGEGFWAMSGTKQNWPRPTLQLSVDFAQSGDQTVRLGDVSDDGAIVFREYPTPCAHVLRGNITWVRQTTRISTEDRGH